MRVVASVFVFVVAAVLSGGAAVSFRKAQSLATLAKTSDLVAIGEIAGVSDGNYTLKVTALLKGVAPGGSLTIVRSSIPATEPRWAPYAPGQMLAVFLRRSSGATWKLAGFSVDGELPLDDRYAYLVGHFVEGLPVSRFATLNTTIIGQRVPRKTFEDAVSVYVRCFSNSAGGSDRTCPKLSDYAARSPLHEKMATESLTR